MDDISNISNKSDYKNQNEMSNISKGSKNGNLNITKISNVSNEFKELNKEIFQTIEDGHDLSGVNNNMNLSESSNNISNSLPSFNDINWKKKSFHENSSFMGGNSSNLSNVSDIVPKRQIEILNMKNTYEEKDLNNINNNVNNYINNNINNNNKFVNKNKNYNKFSMVPEDSIYPQEFMENNIHFTNVKKINKNEILPFNNDDVNNNLILNYNQTNLISMNNSNTNHISSTNKNFIKKSNYQMMVNNNLNNNFNKNNNMNIPNSFNNNLNNNNPQNLLNQSSPFMYYQNKLQQNNFYFQPNSMFFPENAFSYNNTPLNTQKNQKNKNLNNSNNNNNSNKNGNTEKKEKKKKKFKDKIEQKLFVIDIDNLINGTDERTTVMIRHIPNKYTSEALLSELNTICKNKYDFFYLPLDNENECNLGYAFINFVHPLHIVHFYHIFKARKWKLYKSNKECDLSFAKFQGKSELTANLDKNMDNFEDKSKLPLVFETNTSEKIDLEKKYFNDIKKYQEDKMKNINWI